MQNSKSQHHFLLMIMLGNILETYDYSLYGYFAPILGKLFFPTISPSFALFVTFSVFAIGFIMRPLGAALFGNYGDKYGRKKILLISIMLMALPTTIIGLLPTYADIGIFAGLLLIFSRLLQGLAVGGELVGTMIYTNEQAPENRKAFYSALCFASGYIALLLTAIIVASVTYFLSQDRLEQWGWRIPFLLGIILGIFGFFIRSKLSETQVFQTLLAKKSTVAYPFFETITKLRFNLLIGIGMVSLHVFGFYFLFVYMTSYLNLYFKTPTATISLINIIVIIFAAFSLPLIGFFAEKINKQYFMLISTTCFILFSYPLIKLFNEGTFVPILIGQCILVFLLCLTSAVLPLFLTELFPPALRFTGIGLSYNLSAVIFGGTAPLMLTYLLEKTEKIAAPSYALIFIAALTLGSLLIFLSRKHLFVLKTSVNNDYPCNSN